MRFPILSVSWEDRQGLEFYDIMHGDGSEDEEVIKSVLALKIKKRNRRRMHAKFGRYNDDDEEEVMNQLLEGGRELEEERKREREMKEQMWLRNEGDLVGHGESSEDGFDVWNEDVESLQLLERGDLLCREMRMWRSENEEEDENQAVLQLEALLEKNGDGSGGNDIVEADMQEGVDTDLMGDESDDHGSRVDVDLEADKQEGAGTDVMGMVLKEERRKANKMKGNLKMKLKRETQMLIKMDREIEEGEAVVKMKLSMIMDSVPLMKLKMMLNLDFDGGEAV